MASDYFGVLFFLILTVILIAVSIAIEDDLPLNQSVQIHPRANARFRGNTPIVISPSKVSIIPNTSEITIYSPETNAPQSVKNLDVRTNFPLKRHVFTKTRSDFKSESEMLCCEILEDIVQEEVHSNIKPKWLKNPKTGYPLELDCYYEKLKIAIEYQGPHHYKLVKKFHKNGLESLKEVKEKDRIKKELCKQQGVRLICVPYIVDCGEKNENGEWKYVSRPPNEKRKLLRKFLEPLIYDLMEVQQKTSILQLTNNF